MTGISGPTSTGATSPNAPTNAVVPASLSSTAVTSGVSAAGPSLLLDMGSSPSDGGLSGLRLPQSFDDVTAILTEAMMTLNGTMSKARANGIEGAFAGRLGTLAAAAAAAATALKQLPDALKALADGQADLAAGQAALKTDQDKLDASQADLDAANGDLGAAQKDVDDKNGDIAAKTGDIDDKNKDIDAAQGLITSDNTTLGQLRPRSDAYGQSITSLSGQSTDLTKSIADATAQGDTDGAASLQSRLDGVQRDLATAQSAKAGVDEQIGALNDDITSQGDRVKLDQSWITTDRNAVSKDGDAIQADNDRITADQSRISTDKADIVDENNRITADNGAINAANKAIKDATKAIQDIQAQLQAPSLIIASQLALTSGTDDRSRNNVVVSTQLDLGFERLQKSAEESHKKDQHRTAVAQGTTPDSDASAPGSRAHLVAEGFTAALEAARATMLQLAQQATPASASASLNRARLTL